MAANSALAFIQHVRNAVFLQDGAGLSDGHLLRCFVEDRDEAAFAALVKRHGPMVWGVCRRLLNHHDAEDAFQAAFLVLARKAASIVPSEMLANWLYGVAHRTALHTRRTGTRRRAKERQVTEMPNMIATQQTQWQDLRHLLDQELSRLPDNYRAVVVLCDLEGKTRKEVAHQLGVPQGTVAGRLARARVILAKRLAQHDVVLSGGTLAVLMSHEAASASVPASVVSSTTRAASLFAAGQSAVAGAISTKVAALTEGVLKTMLITKLKTGLAVLLAVALVMATVGVGGLLHHARAGSPSTGIKSQRSGTAPKAEKQVQPPKEAAKGAEAHKGQDALPGGLPPVQIFVSFDKEGGLLVRERNTSRELVHTDDGEAVYQRLEISRVVRIPIDDAKVFDMKGKPVDAQALRNHLKDGLLALAAHDLEEVDPLQLRLYRKDTLLFVLSALPVPTNVPPAPPVKKH